MGSSKKEDGSRGYKSTLNLPTTEFPMKARLSQREPELLEGRPESLGSDSVLLPPVVLGEGVRIGTGCRIGPNVYLEGPCVIEDDVQLEDTVVLQHVTIERGRRVGRRIVWADDVTAGSS